MRDSWGASPPDVSAHYKLKDRKAARTAGLPARPTSLWQVAAPAGVCAGMVAGVQRAVYVCLQQRHAPPMPCYDNIDSSFLPCHPLCCRVLAARYKSVLMPSLPSLLPVCLSMRGAGR